MPARLHGGSIRSRRRPPGSHGRLRLPVSRHQLHRSGRSARAHRLDDLLRRRRDERVREGAHFTGERVHAASDDRPVPAGDRRSAGTAGHHGLQDAPGDPELLGLRGSLLPVRPHVRARRLLDAALAPLPDLGLVGVLPRPAGSDELRPRGRLPRGPEVPRSMAGRDLACGRRDEVPAALHLGAGDLAAVPTGRQLGLLRRRRVMYHAAVQRTQRAEDRGRAEPAARVPRDTGDRAVREHPTEQRLLRDGRAGKPSLGFLGRAGQGRGRSSRPTTSRWGRHTSRS